MISNYRCISLTGDSCFICWHHSFHRYLKPESLSSSALLLPQSLPQWAAPPTPHPRSHGSMTPSFILDQLPCPHAPIHLVFKFIIFDSLPQTCSGNDCLLPEILQHLAARVPWIYPPHCSQNNLYTSDHIPAGLRVESKLLTQPAGLFGICHLPHL